MDNKPLIYQGYPPAGGEQAGPLQPLTGFPISLGTEMIVEIQNVNQRIKVALAGIEKESFLLIKLSPNDLMGTFRSEAVMRSPVNVKFQHKDKVYSFHTEIQNIVSNPCKLMFLSFPKAVEETLVRPGQRRVCALPAMIMVSNDIVDINIADISKDGCQCVIKISGTRGEMLQKIVHVNSVVDLMVNFPETKERLRIAGRIRNIGSDAENISLGMQFENLSPEARTRIEGFIAKMG